MVLPGQPPPGMSGSRHGPFGEKAFHGALIGCGALVIIGLLMVVLGGQAVTSVGTSFLVLGVLGLVTGAAGLLAERHLERRHPAPPPDVYRQNGHRARPPKR